MNALSRELNQSLNSIIVAKLGRCLARSAINNCASEWASVLQERQIHKALIQSDDPADLISALLACLEQGIDLFVAHENLSSTKTKQILKDFGIQIVLPSLAVCDPVPSETTDPTARAGGEKVVLMTSGTTGDPKLVEHTLNTLLARILPSASLPGNRDGRWLMTYQATTFAGLQVILTACLTGGTIVLPTQRTAAAFYEAAMEHRVTHISGTPTFWRSFLLVSKPGSLSDLRQITIGGEAIDQATLERLSRVFPQARLTHIYASTEAGALFAVHDRRQGFPAQWLNKGIQDVRLRIRDDQLEVQSRHRIAGYARGYGLPITSDGWLMTRDRVRLEGDRVLFVGRNDSIINVGGTKISPEEIEDYLLAIPDVADARVKGVPNPITGQVAVAEIVVVPGADPDRVRLEAMRRCREGLAPQKAPRVIRLVSSIPVQASGKRVRL